MSQKKIQKIDRLGAPRPRENSGAESPYAFVFSDNILDWQRSTKREKNRQNYEIEKERKLIKRLEAIHQQESDKLATGATNNNVETQRKAKHPKHKPNAKGRAANINP